MPQSKLPRSVRKHIRKEKARIRREVLDLDKQEELISQLYQKFFKQYNLNYKDNKSEEK